MKEHGTDNVLSLKSLRLLLLAVACFALSPAAQAVNRFDVADFSGVYVAAISGNFTGADGGEFVGYLYLNADGQGRASGFWEVVPVCCGGTFGDVGDPSTTEYTVEPTTGLVRLMMRGIGSSSAFQIQCFLGNGEQEILGFVDFILGGGTGGGIGSARGTKQ